MLIDALDNVGHWRARTPNPGNDSERGQGLLALPSERPWND